MSGSHSSPQAATALTVHGTGTSPGVASGPLLRIRGDLPEHRARGTILVAQRAAPDDIGRILAAAGTVTLSGALLSHVSLLSREFGKPAVSLGPDGPVRLLNGGFGLLEIGEASQTEATPVLHEGDIVVIDGEAGTLRVPAAFDRDLHAHIRDIHALLLEYASSGDEAQAVPSLLRTVRLALEPVLSFLVEALLFHRIVPSGKPARRLIEALSQVRGLSDELARQRRVIEGHLAERASSLRRSFLAGLSACAAMDELLRFHRDTDHRLAEIDGHLQVLSSDLTLARAIQEEIREAAARRGAQLREGLEAQLARASTLTDEELLARSGGIFHLLRTAQESGLTGSLEDLRRRLGQRIQAVRAPIRRPLTVAIGPEPPQNRSLVGGKAAGLIDLARGSGFRYRMPRGFVVTSAAYRLHLLGEPWERLRRIVRDEPDEAAASRLARATILGVPLPDEVVEAISRELALLGPTRLAVRSSASVEDAPAVSLAGLLETHLGVTDLKDLVVRVRAIWASLWSPRAMRTLKALGRSPLTVDMAALVQELIATRCAGILFSRDPSGRPDSMLVNACWGLGEGISRGETPGDLYRVERSTGRLLAVEVGRASTKVCLDPCGSGTEDVPLVPQERGQPCLDDDKITRLAGLARWLEERTGRAQDVEFGFTPQHELVLFQVRRVVAPHGIPPRVE